MPFTNGSFCLATPIRIKLELVDDNSVLSFITKLLVPFLFAACYWKKTGKRAFREGAHGGAGILEEYCIIFGIHDPTRAKQFLELLAKYGNLRNVTCPCGSGQDLKSCHYALLNKISKLQSVAEFKQELNKV